VPLAIAGSCWRLGASDGGPEAAGPGEAAWLSDCRWLFNGAGVPVGFRVLRGRALGFALRVGGGPAFLGTRRCASTVSCH
jgi:hypothetical protein